MSQSSHLLVAAFDFGTTFSGYAFSFMNDPLKVQTNQGWNASSEKLISLKTPTCVLLNREKEFHSFGFEAENNYANLAEEGKHHGWLFFNKFKMLLHNNGRLSRTTTVEDINGQSMPAMSIFSMSIRYLKDHLLHALQKQATGFEETDIQYVITVPAIWDDSAKQFMREAAEKADIDKSRLKLALEPEAASIWCQMVTTDAKGTLACSENRYMVIDLGGGTADISVHEKNTDGTLKELHKASGGPWGGMYVDKNYIKWLGDVYGPTALEQLKHEEMADYFDIFREFEVKKRCVTTSTEQPIIFRISAMLKEIFERDERTTLQDKLASLDLGENVSIKRDKMKVNSSIVRSWFDTPVDNVIKHVNGIFADAKMKSLDVILLVGGFAESLYVQDKLRKAFLQKRLVIPSEAGLAVLKGAVRFGHVPDVISSRVMNFTYGIRKMKMFDESIYDMSTMSIFNGKQVVRNVFDIFVRAGETIRHGQEITRTVVPNDMNSTGVRIFCSTDPNPMFTTESSCRLLGVMAIEHIEGNTLQDKKFDAIMIFGESELFVKIRMRESGKEFFTTIDCL